MSLLLRPALYYPRLHFQSIDWLKETLLSFRQVRRIVPENFQFNDPEEVQALRKEEIKGLGPMIMDESVDDEWPERAQGRLYDWISARSSAALAEFDRDHAEAEYGAADTFQVHVGKFMDTMLGFLQQNHLAWPPNNPHRGDEWIAVHPRIGDALMSVMALAIAERKQLNIVTSEARVHHALLTRREEDVFTSLAEKDGTADSELVKSDDLATDAAQLVIHKTLDLSWVSLADIAAIVRDGNDFQRFRARLQEMAKEVGWSSVPDPAEQAKQAAALAEAARDEWETYRRSLGSFSKMYVDTAIEDKSEAMITAGITAGVPALIGVASLSLATVGVGLLVGALTVGSKTLRKFIQRRKTDPYRYLSRLTERGATLIADAAEEDP